MSASKASDTGGAAMIVQPVTRRVFYAPSAGRCFFTRRAAFNAEAKARFYSRCECEHGGAYEPGDVCDIHWPDGKYTTRREDGTTLTGRIIRRWSRLLEAQDRAARRAGRKAGR